MRDIRRLVRGDQSRPHLVVAFARRHGIAPFLTRAARLGGKFGHTATWDEEQGVFHESLVWHGAMPTPEKQWFGTYSSYDLIAVPCPEPERALEFKRAQSERRTPYDYKGAWSVLYRGDWQDGDRLYCTESEVLALMRGGLTLFADHQRGIHPHDLWRVCAAFS